MSIFNFLSPVPQLALSAPVWVDKINATRYGAVEAFCIGHAEVGNTWTGMAFLDKEGRATLLLPDGCLWQDLGEGGDLLGWVNRHLYLGEACVTCGTFHDPKDLTMVGRQCNPCVYKEAQDVLNDYEILALPPGDECCPCCGTTDIRSDWKFCRWCGTDLR
jgi:hypothetical protein